MKKIFLMAILLSMYPLAGLAEKGKARIITHNEKPVQCLSSVVIEEIDGAEAAVHSGGFDLEPGRHSMNGRAMINTRYCTVVRGNQSSTVPDLEAVFEAGKTYYVGLDHSSKNRNEWKLVIWKVEGGDS